MIGELHAQIDKAQHGMVMGSTVHNDVDISYLADTVLLFRYFEAEGSISQAISVFKKRTGSHERTIRQLRIDSDGVRVGDPLRQFRGIMTGVPLYAGSEGGHSGCAPTSIAGARPREPGR